MNTDRQAFFTRTFCPLCESTIVLAWQPDNIPFFGEVIYTTSRCECGFRYTDTMILDQREPVRYSLRVDSPEDMGIRVIRSTSGTVRIPELGIVIEPGPASESYVSNVEGVLCRIMDVVGMVSRWEEEPPEAIERAHELLQALDQIRSGEMGISLIVEDPMGNSAITSEKATVETLTPEEAENLKTGMIVFETDDLPQDLL